MRTRLTQASFEKAKLWVKELQRQASPHIVIALVGNKIDLVAPAENTDADTDADDAEAPAPAEREVPYADAEAYAHENQLLFFETSAKTGEHVLEVFTEIGTFPTALTQRNTSRSTRSSRRRRVRAPTRATSWSTCRSARAAPAAPAAAPPRAVVVESPTIL